MDLWDWAETRRRPEARIGRDEIGDVTVSTVWLGLDHSFDAGPPLIFETMIFGGRHDGEQWRYSTREEVAEGHGRAVALASPGRLDRLLAALRLWLSEIPMPPVGKR